MRMTKILWCEVVKHTIYHPILYTISFGLWAEQGTALPLVFFSHCRESQPSPLNPFPSFKTNVLPFPTVPIGF